MKRLMLLTVALALPLSGVAADSQLEYKIVQAEAFRAENATAVFDGLRHKKPRLVERALLAVARIGDRKMLNIVVRHLNHKTSEVRQMAAFTLGQLDGVKSRASLRDCVAKKVKQPRSRAACIDALGFVRDQKSYKTIVGLATKKSHIAVRVAAVKAWGLYLRDQKLTLSEAEANQLLGLVRDSARVAVPAGVALRRLGKRILVVKDQKILARKISLVRYSQVKANVTELLGYLDYKISKRYLRNLRRASNPEIRISAYRAYSKFSSSNEIRDLVLAGLADHHESVAITALGSLEKLGLSDQKTKQVIKKTYHHTPKFWFAAKLLRWRAKHDSKDVAKKVKQLITHGNRLLRNAAIKSLYDLKDPSVEPTLIKLIQGSDLKDAAAAVEGFKGKISHKMALAFKVALTRSDLALTYYVADQIKKHKLGGFRADLIIAYSKFKKGTDLEAMIAILDALGVVGDKTKDAKLLAKITSDPLRPVALAAARALKNLTGKDLSAQVVAQSKYPVVVPGWREIVNSRRVVEFKTTKGNFRLLTFRDTPLTSVAFLNLVASRYYNGKDFHRVVPNFVVQGGDPRGDGFGGAGNLWRDEVSRIPHNWATVGIATAGKDTGGGQIFVNLLANPHLEGRYTVFARVLSGMTVVRSLSQGDKIKSARIVR